MPDDYLPTDEIEDAVQVLLSAWSAGTVRAASNRQQKLREWWPALGAALDNLKEVTE